MLDLPRPVAFVLSGGASIGSVQVGMLRALGEAGVGPDLAVGTSVGAINGAVVAADPKTAADRLWSIWSKIRREDVFPGSRRSQAITLLRSRTHVFPHTGLATLIRRNMTHERFEDLALPFAAVATDARTGHPAILRSGPLLPALLASAAIPGIYPTVEIDGNVYVDGGVTSNVPMHEALELGASSVVVLDPGFPCHRDVVPHSLPEMLLFTGAVLLRQHALCALPEVARRVPVVCLPSPCPQATSPFDFTHSIEQMERAHTSARDFLSRLTIVGPGLYGALHVHDGD